MSIRQPFRAHSVDDPTETFCPHSEALKQHFMRRARRRSVADPFDYDEHVPIPEVPDNGVRIKVCYAGACYSHSQACGIRIQMAGIRDTSLFPGYEVSGIIDELSEQVEAEGRWQVGARVVVFPCEDVINKSDFSEYITISDTNSLVEIPDDVSLEVAAMMPSGALLAYNAVLEAKRHIDEELIGKGSHETVHLLIVGAGGLGLTTLLIAKHILSIYSPDIVRVVVADPCDDKLTYADQIGCYRVIHWTDVLYEEQIIERTLDACPEGIDVVIDFVSSPRTTQRVLEVLNEGGLVISEDHSRSCIRINPETLDEKRQRIVGVPKGSPEQLRYLLGLLDRKELTPPPYTVFPVEEANRVFKSLVRSKHVGRAVLKVSKEELESIFEK